MTDYQPILATLDEYAEAYCSKDLERVMALFVEGNAISLIGTGDDELRSGRVEVSSVFERNFRDATATRFEWGWRDVAVHGEAATVAIALVIHLIVADAEVKVPVRWTVSLVNTTKGWKWVHRHASVAADTQKKGNAYPIGDR